MSVFRQMILIPYYMAYILNYFYTNSKTKCEFQKTNCIFEIYIEKYAD